MDTMRLKPRAAPYLKESPTLRAWRLNEVADSDWLRTEPEFRLLANCRSLFPDPFPSSPGRCNGSVRRIKFLGLLYHKT